MNISRIPKGRAPEDHVLTDEQEAELTMLLHRASQAVAVDTPPIELLDQIREPRRLSRWALPAAAAALVVVVGAGVVLSTGGEGERVIESAPATQAPSASILQSGVGPWRLPPETAKIEVVGLSEATFPLSFGYALDDPADPQRWVASMDGSFDLRGTEPTRIETLETGATMAIYSPGEDSITGATWAIVNKGSDGSLVWTLVYRGLSDAEVIATVEGSIAATPPGRAAADQLSVVVSDLAETIEADRGSVEVSFDGLEGASSGGASMDLKLHPDDGGDVGPLTVTSYETGYGSAMAPKVAGLLDRILVEGSQAPGMYEPQVTDRADLGPGAFEILDSDGRTLFVYDPLAGTAIRVTSRSDGGRPATEAEVLDLLSSLVPMSKADFSAEASRRGLMDLGIEPMETTTTTTESPAAAVNQPAPTSLQPGASEGP